MAPMLRAAAAFLFVLLTTLPASAQAPDASEMLYLSACFVRATGDTKGQALQITRAPGGYTFMFQDFRGYPRPPEPATGQIAGNRITFDARVVGLPVHFEGTITAQDIKGHFSNAENDSRYLMDVQWQIWPIGKLMPDCK